MSHFLEEDYHVVTNSFGRSEGTHEKLFCELYVVKAWEGMVQNSLRSHTIPKAWHVPWFLCSFSCYTVGSILYA